MGILVEQELVVSQSIEYDITSVLIRKNIITGKWDAVIGYNILKDTGSTESKKSIIIPKEEFNHFWSNDFNDFLSVYKVLKNKLALPVEVDPSVEQLIVNT